MHATPATWQMLVDGGWMGRDTLVAVSGGDVLSEALAAQLLGRCPQVWNGYGPTETTVYATFSRVAPGGRICIGRPIANVRTYIVDGSLQPLPVGAGGELLIGGAGIADGYVDRAAETEERFIADPFVPGGRVYRTGDLARFLRDGSIVHMGRIDRQVKIRGVRIEPGEIEGALLRHPAISDAVVTVAGDGAADRRLVGYYVANGAALGDADVQRWLQQTLPRHMVPAALVRMKAFPATASGKVDRDALPPPHWGTSRPQRLVLPRTALETELAAIWSRLLGVDTVGVDDDFFDLGGHSLLAVRLLATIDAQLGVDVPIADFIEGAATVARQAAYITAARATEANRELLVRAQPLGTRPPLFFVLPTPRAMFVRHYVGPLGEDQPVFAVLGPQQNGEAHRYSGDLTQLAAPRVRAIRAEQPHGPYHLAGYSLGGLLAYEIAGQLRKQGEQVAWLALLNTATPEALARFWRRRYLRVGQVAMHVSPMTAWRTVRDQLTASRLGAGLRRARLADSFDPHAAIQLSLEYRCEGHDAPLVIFATADEMATIRNTSLGWDRVHRGSIEVQRAPGDHRALVRPTKEVGIAAEMLARSLRAAQSSR